VSAGAASPSGPERIPAELPVSVIIPAYERAALVRRALTSVAAQRPARPAEVIVVDDGSRDGTARVAESLGARVIRHERNLGAAAARNTALAAATQPWIAPLDSDDEWLPWHLATLWPLREGHVLVAGSALQVGAHRSGGLLHGPDRDRPVALRSPAQVVAPYNPIPASAVLVRRDAALAAGGYDATLAYAEDWDLWIRVLEWGTGLQSPAVVLRYRRHEGQKTGACEGPQAAQRRIVESYRGRPWWSEGLLERRQSVLAWEALRADLRAGRRREALAHGRWLAARPVRVRAVAELWLHRRRLRARSGRVVLPEGT
jgi:hypothetical protein